MRRADRRAFAAASINHVVLQMKMNDKSQIFPEKTFVFIWKDYTNNKPRVEMNNTFLNVGVWRRSGRIRFTGELSMIKVQAWSAAKRSSDGGWSCRGFSSSSAHHYQRSLRFNAANNSV